MLCILFSFASLLPLRAELLVAMQVRHGTIFIALYVSHGCQRALPLRDSISLRPQGNGVLEMYLLPIEQELVDCLLAPEKGEQYP